MNSIETIDLHIYYGDTHAIKDVSLQIPEKGIFAIMGPSGCGKSTLLRAFNRLLELNKNTRIEGDIRFFDQSIFKMNAIEIRRHIGMVFQQVNPFPHMSIFDNVSLGLRLNKLYDSKKEINERVEWALRKAALYDEISDRLKAPATALSGGQQQRLCIARALALKPQVLLMDEPTANLDPISTDRIEDLIYELKRDYTIIMVTHSPPQAARVSDKVAFLYLGELIEVGNADEIFEAPKKKLTEKFLRGRIG